MRTIWIALVRIAKFIRRDPSALYPSLPRLKGEIPEPGELIYKI